MSALDKAKQAIIEAIQPGRRWERLADELKEDDRGSGQGSQGGGEVKGMKRPFDYTQATVIQPPSSLISGAEGLALKQYNGAELMSPNLRGKAIWKEWDSQAATKEGLKSSTWVFACIYRLAKSAASARWVAERRVGDVWTPQPSSPLQNLIDNPNDHMTRQDFMERTVMSLYLAGNSLTSKVSIRGVPVELWPIFPHTITPIPGDSSRGEDFISRYEFKDGSNKRNFEPNDIVHVMFTDPSTLFWGMSPLQAASRTVDTDNEAVNFNKIALQNRAVADGVFSFDKPLSAEQWSEARSQIRDQHQGSKNARTPWVLGGGATWTQMSLTPAEMDFLESRRFTREEICAVFQVPPPLVGIYDNATLANIHTARLIFWEDTIIPLLDDLQGVFTLKIARPWGEDWRLVYDVSHISVLLENFIKKMDAADRLWSKGVPMSVINQRLGLGLEEFPGWDTGYLPTGLVPAGTFVDSIFGDE